MKNLLVFSFLWIGMMSFSPVFAQRIVEGKILAENNHEPIPYAIIQIMEEGKLVYADERGDFKLVLPDEASTLRITSAGFVKKEMVIPMQARKTVCDISLKSSNSTAKGIAKGKKGKDKNNPAVVKQ